MALKSVGKDGYGYKCPEGGVYLADRSAVPRVPAFRPYAEPAQQVVCGSYVVSHRCAPLGILCYAHTQTHNIHTSRTYMCTRTHHTRTHTHTHTLGFRLYHSAAPRPAAWGIGGRGFRMASKVARTGQYYLFLLVF